MISAATPYNGDVRGQFITIEGPDGCGKGGVVDHLKSVLDPDQFVFVREPGGTQLGEAVRTLLLDTEGPVDQNAEVYLFYAARAQLLSEVILPALERGQNVIADRYHDSTLAYQGGGRGMAIDWPESFLKPDLTLLLSVSAEVAQGRMSKQGRTADRIEREGIALQSRVIERYALLAAEEPDRFRVINAAAPQQTVCEHAARLIKESTVEVEKVL